MAAALEELAALTSDRMWFGIEDRDLGGFCGCCGGGRVGVVMSEGWLFSTLTAEVEVEADVEAEKLLMSGFFSSYSGRR
jgi:hypothetical protein